MTGTTMKEACDSYLKMSVLNAVLTLDKYRNLYPDKTVNELILVIKGIGSYQSNYDYAKAEILLSALDLSPIGGLRELITTVLLHESPSWMNQIPFGREILASSLVDNEEYDVLQCLQSAGLYMKEPDSSVIQWWDEIAQLMRNEDNGLKVKVGRTGELLTFKYEEERLKDFGVKPEWKSIENNFAGYDVLSYFEISPGVKKKLIEVKTCSARPLSFYLSKNEWKSAVKFAESYIIHVWYLPKEQLIELNLSDIEKNIPLDKGSGQWQSVLINIDDIYQRYFDACAIE